MEEVKETKINQTKKENNVEKAHKFAGKALKAVKVLKILTIVAFALCAVAAAVLITLGATGYLTNVLSDHMEDIKDIKFTLDDDFRFMYNANEVYLTQIVSDGKLDSILMYAGEECIGGLFDLAFTFVILVFFGKLLKEIETSESVFTNNILKYMKVCFIFIAILVTTNSLFAGLITIFSLICFYYIYKHGISLQQESEDTI